MEAPVAMEVTALLEPITSEAQEVLEAPAVPAVALLDQPSKPEALSVKIFWERLQLLMPKQEQLPPPEEPAALAPKEAPEAPEPVQPFTELVEQAVTAAPEAARPGPSRSG